MSNRTLLVYGISMLDYRAEITVGEQRKIRRPHCSPRTLSSAQASSRVAAIKMQMCTTGQADAGVKHNPAISAS